MTKIILKKNKGFVLLFAITLSALLLSIALGVASIAFKEVKFGTSARDANNAFFAADTGTEQALYNDKTSGFYPDGNVSNFIISGLGSAGTSCANVTVDKRTSTTTIVSDGYNIGSSGGLCVSSNPNSVQRELKTTYNSSSSSPVNYAAAANGGVASASSQYNSNFPIANVNDGDRLGNNWGYGGTGGGWNDASGPPSWVQIAFSGSKSISEIDVYTLANCIRSCVSIDASTLADVNGISDFQVQYDNSGTWQTVSGGSVVGNTLAWRQFTFPSVTTGKIRVNITAARGSYSRLVEVEAYGGGTPPPPSYAHSRSITITGTVPSPQTNFPVLVNISSADPVAASLKASVTSSQGYDIAFAKNPDGTGLFNWEVEKYDSSTGALTAWVNLDSITNGTVFYMFYGNSSVVSQHNPSSAVWDSNYKGVWHLPNGSSLTANDSTSNGVNGTLVNSPVAVAGQIDGAASFTSGSNNISFGNKADIATQDMSIEYWINAPNVNQVGGLIAKRQSASNYNQFNTGIGDASNGGGLASKQIFFFGYDGAGNFQERHTTGSVVDGNWHHVVVTRNSSGILIYIDGTSASLVVGNAGLSSENYTNPGGLYFNSCDAVCTGNLTVKMDEARISIGIARSADWIKTEYNNQSAPASFYSIGAEQ